MMAYHATCSSRQDHQFVVRDAVKVRLQVSDYDLGVAGPERVGNVSRKRKL